MEGKGTEARGVEHREVHRAGDGSLARRNVLKSCPPDAASSIAAGHLEEYCE